MHSTSTTRRFLVPGVLLLAAIGILVWQANTPAKAQGESQPGKIVTVGTAELKAEPDMATVVVGVQSELASNAGLAQNEAAVSMAAVRRALTELGIAEKAVQTRNFRVGPEYQYDKGKQELLGYRASHDLLVQVDRVTDVGKVLDAVVKAGATQVRQIDFALKDSKAILQQALEQAVQDAQTKAQALAAGAGVKVKRIVRIQDQSNGGISVRQEFTGFKQLSDAAASTAIAAGEITILANVEVEFEFE